MTQIIQNQPVKRNADTLANVFFHCPTVVEVSTLDAWAIEQVSYLSSVGWRLSRFRSAGNYHLLSPSMGEA
jgi:hypothetical protein